MSTELFRNYLDIINENSQPRVQLDEGMLDGIINWAKSKAQALASKASPEAKEAIIQMVTQASGGQKPTLNLSTIKNVAAQLKPVAAGVKEKMQQMQGQQQPDQDPALAEGLKDVFAKYGGKAALAGGVAAGYAADKVGDIAHAVGNAAANTVQAGNFLTAMQWEVARMGAANQASFNLDLAAYALAALCVILVCYSWLHGQGDFPGAGISRKAY